MHFDGHVVPVLEHWVHTIVAVDEDSVNVTVLDEVVVIVQRGFAWEWDDNMLARYGTENVWLFEGCSCM